MKTGHSIAELIFSPREIDYTGITRPDAMILLSRDGVSKVGRHLAAMQPDDRVFALPSVGELKTKATLRPGELATDNAKTIRAATVA